MEGLKADTSPGFEDPPPPPHEEIMINIKVFINGFGFIYSTIYKRFS
jgi:hypothetical protein